MWKLLISLALIFAAFTARADSVVMVGFGAASEPQVIIAGRTGTPSSSTALNGGTVYQEWSETVTNAGTVVHGYLYVVNGYDRNVKMFVIKGSTCYWSGAVSVSGITNAWVEFSFSGGPTYTASDAIIIGYISDAGISLGTNSGTGYYSAKADSYSSPTCPSSGFTDTYSVDTGWYVKNY
jgi:hypothetical protein